MRRRSLVFCSPDTSRLETRGLLLLSPGFWLDSIGVVLLQKMELELDDVLGVLRVERGKELEHLAGQHELGVGDVWAGCMSGEEQFLAPSVEGFDGLEQVRFWHRGRFRGVLNAGACVVGLRCRARGRAGSQGNARKLGVGFLHSCKILEFLVQ